MHVKEITMSAVISTAQYNNIAPSITVGMQPGEDVEAAKAEALRHIEQISQQYAEAGKSLPQLHSRAEGAAYDEPPRALAIELVSDLTSESAYFDEVAHIYTNKFGQRFLSGSVFAEGFCPPFDANMIVPKMEAKYGVPGQEIRDMWKAKADASCSIGDAIHKSMEMYGKYRHIGVALDAGKKDNEKKWSHIHNNPILNRAVGEFFAVHDDEQAMYEAFIANNDAMLCGSIDRLLITGDKRCRVQDFKTNADLDKKGSPKFLSAPFGDILNTTLNKYWLQLSFYAHILQLAGWTVEGLDIFHYTDTEDGMTWITYQHPVVDISGAPILQTIRQ
jgi:hypothetical protein